MLQVAIRVMGSIISTADARPEEEDDDDDVPPPRSYHVAVLGGMMKSHHLSVVPFVEGLLDRGHRVSFLVPNTAEGRSYFPNGIGGGRNDGAAAADVVYLGKDEWSFDTLFSGPVRRSPIWRHDITRGHLSGAEELWPLRSPANLLIGHHCNGTGPTFFLP